MTKQKQIPQNENPKHLEGLGLCTVSTLPACVANGDTFLRRSLKCIFKNNTAK